MSLLNKVVAGLAAVVLSGGLAAAGAATASAAPVSSPGCAFSNGCATLHGTDANGNTVAMDAKYQSSKPGTLIIGYPDNANDGATSFDGVLHFMRTRTVSTSPSAVTLQACGLGSSASWASDDSIGLVIGVAPAATCGAPAGSTYDPAYAQVVVNNVAGTAVPTSEPSFVTSNYNAGSPRWVIVLSNGKSLVGYPAKSGLNGTDMAWAVGNGGPYTSYGVAYAAAGANTATVSQAYIVEDADQANATIDTLTGVQYGGKDITRPRDIRVTGSLPYYTFVYAARGVWSSECVTDTNGSGALTLQACTLGRDKGQDFTIDSTNGLLSGGQAHVSNMLAAAVGASSCLWDPSASNAATPQSNAADQVAPGGRQIYTNGSCAAGADLWSWGT